jgi:RNA polymerase sigma factor (sigma-70 family)
MSDSEAILLERFASNGDAEAFAEIVKQHAHLVYGVCLRILEDKDRASDAVQDTFVQLVRDADCISGSLTSWLHRVATCRSIDLIRRDCLRRQRESKYAAEPEKVQSEQETATWQEISGYIDEELDHLEDQTREILLLHFLEGLTTTDIAAKCDISQPTVSRRIEAGVASLRHKLRLRGIITPAAVLTAMLSENAVKAAPAQLMEELGKMAIAGGASAGVKIAAGISAGTAVKVKIIAVAVITILSIGSFIVFRHYNQPTEPKGIQLIDIPTGNITIEQLADICEAIESSFIDITVEFESGVEPQPTIENIKGTNDFLTVGTLKERWSTKRPFDGRSFSSEQGTYMNENGNTFNSTQTQSYNGKIAKYHSIGGIMPDGEQANISDGTITESTRFILNHSSTPFAYSIFRLNYNSTKGLLSELLHNKEFIKFDATVKDINGFNAVCVELLRNAPNYPILHKKEPEYRIYFSVDHGYTPIKYESMAYTGKGSKPSFAVVVTSLEKVADGLWFPKSGYKVDLSDNLTNTYKATKIVINQGLTDKDFDIVFPSGTRVTNEINGSKFVFE